MLYSNLSELSPKNKEEIEEYYFYDMPWNSVEDTWLWFYVNDY